MSEKLYNPQLELNKAILDSLKTPIKDVLASQIEGQETVYQLSDEVARLRSELEKFKKPTSQGEISESKQRFELLEINQGYSNFNFDGSSLFAGRDAPSRSFINCTANLADFSQSNLAGSSFSGFEAKKTDFSDSNLSNVKANTFVIFEGNFNNSDLSNSNFDGLSFDGCSFVGADLTNGRGRFGKVRSEHKSAYGIVNCDFRSANLTNLYFDIVESENGNYAETLVHNLDLRGTNLFNSWIDFTYPEKKFHISDKEYVRNLTGKQTLKEQIKSYNTMIKRSGINMLGSFVSEGTIIGACVFSEELCKEIDLVWCIMNPSEAPVNSELGRAYTQRYDKAFADDEVDTKKQGFFKNLFKK